VSFHDVTRSRIYGSAEDILRVPITVSVYRVLWINQWPFRNAHFCRVTTIYSTTNLGHFQAFYNCQFAVKQLSYQTMRFWRFHLTCAILINILSFHKKEWEGNTWYRGLLNVGPMNVMKMPHSFTVRLLASLPSPRK